MILYLSTLFLAILSAGLSMLDECRDKKNLKTFCKRAFLFILPVVLTIAFISNVIALCISYYSYATCRAQHDSIISQYRQAVVMYDDRAELDISKITFTDFAYQGYQQNIATMITDLRSEVTAYNKKIVMKKTYKKNIFFSWLIVAPDDDMLPINMIGELPALPNQSLVPSTPILTPTT